MPEGYGLTEQRVRIGPSILAADFLRLGEQIAEAEAAGADFVHVDVMDGRFVPNISVGLPVIAAVRAATKLPVDVHLMIVEPDRWVSRVVEAGADLVSVHVEADPNLHRTLRAIAEAGGQPSVTLNPATPLVMLEEVVPLVRQVLVMSVNPGFGGQTFIPGALDSHPAAAGLAGGAQPDLPAGGGRRDQGEQRPPRRRGRRRHAGRRDGRLQPLGGARRRTD